MVSGFRQFPAVAAGIAALTAILCVVILIARRRRGGASLRPEHWTPRTIAATAAGLIVAFVLNLGACFLLHPAQFR